MSARVLVVDDLVPNVKLLAAKLQAEYFDVVKEPNGDQWLTLISELRDPQYYSETWVVSTHFKKVPDNSAWNPEPCSAR